MLEPLETLDLTAQIRRLTAECEELDKHRHQQLQLTTQLLENSQRSNRLSIETLQLHRDMVTAELYLLHLNWDATELESRWRRMDNRVKLMENWLLEVRQTVQHLKTGETEIIGRGKLLRAADRLTVRVITITMLYGLLYWMPMHLPELLLLHAS